MPPCAGLWCALFRAHDVTWCLLDHRWYKCLMTWYSKCSTAGLPWMLHCSSLSHIYDGIVSRCQIFIKKWLRDSNVEMNPRWNYCLMIGQPVTTPTAKKVNVKCGQRGGSGGRSAIGGAGGGAVEYLILHYSCDHLSNSRKNITRPVRDLMN